MGAAGFKQNRETIITERRHQRERGFLQQWLAARQFDQRQPCRKRSAECGVRSRKRRGETVHLRAYVLQRLFFSLGKCIGRIAIGAPQIAGGEPDENARQPGKGALPLQAQVNLVDDEGVGHGRESS